MNKINKIYGYCRISTKKQSLQRQIDNIRAKYPDAEIVAEVFTGTTADRPKWLKLMKVIKSGDMIVFDSVSRMSRNASEGFGTYKELFNKSITLEFLKESYINTETYKQAIERTAISVTKTGDKSADKLIASIMQAIQEYQLSLAEKQIELAFEQSEKEVQDLHTRTSEGMRASGAGEKISKARTGNSYETKKCKEAKEIIRKHSKTFGGTLSDSELQELAKISRNTLYKYKAEIKAEQ